MTILLELTGITKVYPGVTALDGISLSVGRGEVLGLIGENGAGKSTLMKILGGVVAPTAGTIRINGWDHDALSVNQSMRAGIAFVHQELNLFENLDVAANIGIGREPRVAGMLIDRKRLRDRVAPLLERFGADFGPDAPVAGLSIAQRQLVEIARALSINARIIIMDEPTSSLTLRETERLLEVIGELRAGGVSVIYISHRLGEVKACADRVVCLRDGRIVGELVGEDIAHATMIRLMIGRDLKALYIPPAGEARDGGCDLVDVVTSGLPGPTGRICRSVQGRSWGWPGWWDRAAPRWRVRCLGSIRSSGAKSGWTGRRCRWGRRGLRSGRASIWCRRTANGRGWLWICLWWKTSPWPASGPMRGSCWSIAGRERAVSSAQRARLSIRAPDDRTQVVTLSGGNQQKVVLAKWLSMQPRVVIFDEPTRGIDVGAKNEIYALMRGLADAGVCILMISSDMEEVIGVSDRIAVMHEGAISGVLERPQFSEYNVLRLAIGQAVGAD